MGRGGQTICITILIFVNFFIDGNVDKRYIGCYGPGAVSSLEWQIDNTTTIKSCIAACHFKNRQYAALKVSLF